MRNTGKLVQRRSPTLDQQPVPDDVATLFWDAPGGPLELRDHEALLVRRVLNQGSWSACCWLREQLGDTRIRGHLEAARGRGFERRTLRLWQVLLGIPADQVDEWLAQPERRLWDRRAS